MLLHSLEISNYRSLEHIKLDNLQQFNVLIGRNNAGKSSVFQTLYELNNIYANRGISADVLTRHDNTRALEINFTFKPNQQEREEFAEILIATGFAAQRRTAVLESPFLRMIRFSFKSMAGNPSVMHLREMSILAEDGRWAVVQRMTGNEQIANPEQNYVLISAVSVSAVQYPLEASLFDIAQTQHRTTANVIYNRIFAESWISDLATRWLYTQLGKYLSEAFFFNPFRHSTAVLGVTQTNILVQDGANLAQVLHTLKTSEEETFDEIERFVQGALPDIGRLRTPLINTTTNVVFRHSEQSYSIPLTDMGGGIEQLLMIATVLLMPRTQKSTLFLEEPENHLHAGAQRYLIEQLYKGERQIFLSTHSPTFINITRPHSLYQVINKEGRTNIIRRDAASLDPVLEDIGVRNSDVLLSDAVLFVEGSGDRDVLTVFSDKLHMSFDENNINVIPMGGGRHAERGVPIRSGLLNAISSRAPVPHLFLLDRDERGEQEIHSLEERLVDKVHIFQARELENYLLVPRAILSALRSKQRDSGASIDSIDTATERQIEQLINSSANDLYNTVLIKRIRTEIGGLRDGLLPSEALPTLITNARSEHLAGLVMKEINSRWVEHLEKLEISTIVSTEEETLERAWSDSRMRLQLAPGEEILSAVFRAYGLEYSKPTDTVRIARAMEPEEIQPEIVNLIKQAYTLAG